jgi:hypothetical protein
MSESIRYESAERVRDFYREQGRKQERERILKLLEEEISRVSNPMLVDREYLDGLEVAIALIKGENK